MMGNQRQVLKDNIQKELVAKIETAKDVLSQLSKSLEACKLNSISAKEEIRMSADAVKDVLVERKKELIQEVDQLHQIQLRSLQDAMKSTWITMGRLQCLLTNLEYYDQSQLAGLQIPTVNTTCTISEPSQINVDLQSKRVKEELSDWGIVTADGFTCCMGEKMPVPFIPPPASLLPNMTPFETRRDMLSLSSNKENQIVPTRISAVCESCPWRSWGIDKWLSSSKSRKISDASEKDDFLMVTSPCSENFDMDFEITSSELDASSNVDDQQIEQNDSDSSIVCIEKDTKSEISDLSAWLKPRKQANPLQVEGLDTSLKHNALILSSDASNFLSCGKRSANFAEKRTLDFPCLLMDADNWVHKKKSKSTCSAGSSRSSSFLAHEQKLIPPAYALPNPFWLKKYQHQR